MGELDCGELQLSRERTHRVCSGRGVRQRFEGDRKVHPWRFESEKTEVTGGMREELM